MWTVARLVLAGPDLSHFDRPVGEIFKAHEEDLQANDVFLASLKQVRENARAAGSMKKGFAVAREFADSLSVDLDSDCAFEPVVANGVDCEWTVAPGADPKRRLLFLHGGAFLLGSPRGHRI
ncbi:MAG: alpha/beta hydrolase, partial [Gammaproteobacteria bacterium]|nr:alpha/beta hydrolase [Gammaproteobacteria bacterium]